MTLLGDLTLRVGAAGGVGRPLAGPVGGADDEGPSCYSRLTNEWFCADYLRDRGAEVADATVAHLQITAAAIVLGLVLAVPLALLARRRPRLEGPVLGFSTGLYTIPSIALFPLLVPFTGLSATTVVLGLALYALTILVRAVLDGLRSVPPEVRDAARGLGYAGGRLLLQVELPLAMPVLIAGLRVATVSTVALTTVGSLVGHGGLGDLIADGVTTNFRAELLTAAVLCVLLAVVLDLLLVVLQRLLTPWTRSRTAAVEVAQ
ncbi:ABC transporter permease [Nocardioides ferulae]|uniref:ABC transporter permease n=1 Tax=Nocardioides ferulae TaxID=2340821 RepID=UPI001F0B91B3|nr:ABC transporter permease [Nocardioides ferulae]